MRRPGEAVHAPVLAALIGIDRAIEADVRRLVARDDRARALERHRRLQRWRRRIVLRPAVVLDTPIVAAKTVRRVERRAAAAFRAPERCDRVGGVEGGIANA